jgi:hypothetical protein
VPSAVPLNARRFPQLDYDAGCGARLYITWGVARLSRNAALCPDALLSHDNSAALKSIGVLDSVA